MFPLGRRSTGATAVLLVLTGCTHQDTESLGRVARTFSDRARATSEVVRMQVDGDLKALPRPAAAPAEASLKDKIETRMRWDALLADAKVEVVVTGADVELRGTVSTDAQRRRAGDIAESTVGVQTVNDALKVEE